MIKVVTPKEMARIEALAYREGFGEIDFMENAGKGIADFVKRFILSHSLERVVCLLCGKGNNSGDAYVAGICLLEQGFFVSAIQVTDIEGSSSLCKKNYQRFIEFGGRIEKKLPSNGVLLDGLFGTGFHGSLKEPFASIVSLANASSLPIIAIDIPSGLNGETAEVEGPTICACETVYLGLPKTGFFFKEGWNLVGKLRGVNFGLEKRYIEQAVSEFSLFTEDFAQSLLPKIVRNRHKYQAGHVVGLSGSVGMPGAALLASTAVLRGGAGIIHLLHPEGMEQELVTSLYEVIKVPYTTEGEVVLNLNRADAAFIGPGIGRALVTRDLLKKVLQEIKVMSVIDADALTIIAEDRLSIPKNAILTPHRGEMARLLQIERVEEPFLTICQDFVEKHQVTLVLKGGPTFIFNKSEKPIVCGTGCPGMATAGSGDVLTGLTASLLAQLSCPYSAAKLAVYLHGLAGEFAQKEMTSYSMIASDITRHFSGAFESIRK